MLIAAYLFTARTLFPRIVVFINAVTPSFIAILIALAGILLLFAAVGVKVSNGLATTVIGNVFKAIGFIAIALGKGIRWIVLGLVHAIPKFFRTVKKTLSGFGLNRGLTMALSILATVLLVAAII